MWIVYLLGSGCQSRKRTLHFTSVELLELILDLKLARVRRSPFLPAAKVRTMETLYLECLCCFNSKLYAPFLQTPSFKSKKPEPQT